MIPLTFLYDEYIDRPKLAEQRKNPFEYIVPPTTSGVGTIRSIGVRSCVSTCVSIVNYFDKVQPTSAVESNF